MTMNFNPNEHLMQIKSSKGSSDYLPVAWRLVWFREQCPQGTIDTEEIIVDLDREVTVEAYVWNQDKRRSEKVQKTAAGYARFKAVITDGKGGRATGTGSECAADFGDFIEKAETKAVGRALAMLGYGTQFAPELSEEHRIVDSPVERHGEASVAQASSNDNHTPTANRSTVAAPQSQSDATEQQLASIRKLCEHLGQAVPVVASFAEAKDWITKLSQAYRESRRTA